eukprot:UN07632
MSSGTIVLTKEISLQNFMKVLYGLYRKSINRIYGCTNMKKLCMMTQTELVEYLTVFSKKQKK